MHGNSKDKKKKKEQHCCLVGITKTKTGQEEQSVRRTYVPVLFFVAPMAWSFSLTQESEREGKEEKVLLNIEMKKGTNKINKREG